MLPLMYYEIGSMAGFKSRILALVIAALCPFFVALLIGLFYSIYVGLAMLLPMVVAVVLVEAIAAVFVVTAGVRRGTILCSPVLGLVAA